MKKEYNLSNREKFIFDLFDFLNNKNYVALKYIEDDISNIEEYSDIDLGVTKELSNEIINFLNNYNNILIYKIYSYSFMNMTYIVFKDKTFVGLDLIHSFFRKNIIYLDINELINNTFTNHNGIKVSKLEYNFLNIFLFYLLNKTNISSKYEEYFCSLEEIEQKNIVDFINKRYKLNFQSIKDLCIYNQNSYKSVTNILYNSNNFFSIIVNYFSYLLNIKVNLSKSKLLNFTRVDDKILKEFTYILENKYRRNVIEIKMLNLKNYINLIKHSLRGDIIIYSQKEVEKNNFLFNLEFDNSLEKIEDKYIKTSL